MPKWPYISIITLNVNRSNAPTKRYWLTEWIQKQDPYICCLQETHFRPRDTYRMKVKGWKKIVHANGNQKKAGVAILISDKIDFKMKTITKDKECYKEGHYIMIKGSIQEEDITTVNIYAPNIAASEYIRQTVSSVQSLSHVCLFATPWITAHQASLSITNSWRSPKLMCIESVMPSAISSSVVPFSSCPQSLPASGSFPVSQLFAWGGQSIGVSASASGLPMNTQDWSPLEWTGWISLQSKGLSRVFSNTRAQKHQFFSAQLSSQANSHIHTWPLEKP